LKWINNRYKLKIYITENGCGEINTGTNLNNITINDNFRIEYFREYLKNILLSIHDDNVNILGYFIRSFIDGFEWNLGYSVRFGIYFVDFEKGLNRKPKASIDFWKDFLSSQKPSFFDSYRPLILIILGMLILIFGCIFLSISLWKYEYFENFKSYFKSKNQIDQNDYQDINENNNFESTNLIEKTEDNDDTDNDLN
jgi:hypothetical protein